MVATPEKREAGLASELALHREELATQNEQLRVANAELAGARARLTLLFDAAPTGYVSLNGRGEVVEANLAFAALVGVERATLLGARFDSLLVPGDRLRFRTYRDRLVNGEGSKACDVAMAAGNGVRLLRIHGACLPAELDDDAPSILSVTDETSRERLAEERRALDAKVSELTRVESLSVMAGGVAHDFNNLLAVVLAQIAFAVDEIPPGSDAVTTLRTAREAATSAAALARQMLAYSGQARVAAFPLDVGVLARSTEPLLRSMIGRRATLVLAIDAAPRTVMGDSMQLQQLMLNLVLNAAEAIGDRGGTITITVSLERGDDGAERVLLRVADDGPGMDEATRQRAFDPFFSTKFTGRGLGLSVSLGNVKAHGGTITVTSARGVGTTFDVLLPTIEARAAPPSRPSSTRQPWRGSGVFLVVDDEPALRAAIARMLRSIGFDVVEAADGRAALDLVTSASPDTPFVGVILDLTMPVMGGAATLQALRAFQPELPVVLTSGYSSNDTVDQVRAQADGFLAKPFLMADLIAALREIPSLA